MALSMKRLMAVVCTATLATGLVTISSAAAAPPSRVQVCHWDAATGTYALLSLTPKAADSHLSHHSEDRRPGDGIGLDCSTAALVFARAWSVNATTGTTVLVARIVDADGSGHLSVGDTVETDQYPLDLYPNGFAAFGVKSHTITSVDYSDPSEVDVTAADGSFTFARYTSFELYFETGPAGTTRLADGTTTANGNDQIRVETGSPSQPATATSWTTTSYTDDGFVNVAIALV